MIKGIFRFIFAVVVFVVVGIAVNPVANALFAATLPWWGVLLCQFVGAGLVIKSGK